MKMKIIAPPINSTSTIHIFHRNGPLSVCEHIPITCNLQCKWTHTIIPIYDWEPCFVDPLWNIIRLVNDSMIHSNYNIPTNRMEIVMLQKYFSTTRSNRRQWNEKMLVIASDADRHHMPCDDGALEVAKRRDNWINK